MESVSTLMPQEPFQALGDAFVIEKGIAAVIECPCMPTMWYAVRLTAMSRAAVQEGPPAYE